MTRLGKYEDLIEIGRGSMGRVYKTVDPMIGRQVAIKVIQHDELDDPGERDWMQNRLFREARAAGVLSHPNIVTVYEVNVEGNQAYIVMEFVEGRTLEQLLADQPILDWRTALQITRQAGAGLDHAHRKGIVHRDVKPANIMLDADGNVKIADFGVAKDLRGRDLTLQGATRTGMIMGTPYYMSPEQIRGKELDGRSDQFALAVIVYRMLTGSRAFEANSIPELGYKIAFEEPAPMQALGGKAAASAVVHRALNKQAGDRFATCTEFSHALDQAFAERTRTRTVTPGSKPVTISPGFAKTWLGDTSPSLTTRWAFELADVCRSRWRFLAGNATFRRKILLGAIPLVLLGVLLAALTMWPPSGQDLIQARPPALPITKVPERPAANSPPVVPEQQPAAVKPTGSTSPKPVPGRGKRKIAEPPKPEASAAAPAEAPAVPAPQIQEIDKSAKKPSIRRRP